MIYISAFCVAPAGLKYVFSLLFTDVLSPDNSIVCFRRKAFLKSDMLAVFIKLRISRHAHVIYVSAE